MMFTIDNIIIHDFFTPDGKGGSKFEYDVYKGQPLNHEYVREKIEKIFGVDGYSHYCLEQTQNNAGVGFYIPK